MDMRKRIGMAMMAFTAVGLAGCPKPDADPTAPGSGKAAPKPGQQLKIALIPKGTENQFWQSIKAGADAACAENNECKIDFVGPNPENDITAQVNIVNNQVSNKVDGIVLAACDKQALIKPVIDSIAAGIPVVTIDSGISSEDPIAYIATDNVKGGEAAADELAKLMDEKGTAGYLIFGKGQVSSDEREKGFVDGMKKHPGIKVLAPLEASDTNKANSNVTNMLTAHPEITGIFAASEPNGISASVVLDQKKLSGKIKLVAFDAGDKEIEALKSGTIQALIVQDPFQMGYKGVKTVMQSIRKQPITERKVDSGLKVVRKDNLETPEIQKLLHPK